MLSPDTSQPMRLVAGHVATYTLRGEAFTLGGPAWECPATGERYTTNDQDFDFVGRLHHAWRERHGIAKEALQQRGKALGLSDAQASALLGFGVNQYRTYKTTDKLPSKSNARLLQMLCDDGALPALLAAAGEALTASARRKLRQHLAQRAGQQARVSLPQVTTRHFDPSEGLLARVTARHHVATQGLIPVEAEKTGNYSYALAA